MARTSAESCAIGILARAPFPGRAKTRLIPALGADGAAGFQRAALLDTAALVQSMPGEARLFLSPLSARPTLVRLGISIPILGQGGGSLGSRMSRALETLLRLRGIDRAILIGTDSPDLPRSILDAAATALLDQPAVIAPAQDGGYVLLGIRRSAFDPGTLGRVLTGVPWSSPETGARTLDALRAGGAPAATIQSWFDIDEPRDLQALRDRIKTDPAQGTLACPHTLAFLNGIDF